VNQQEIIPAKALIIVEIIEYVPNSIVSRTILKKTTGNVSLMSLDTGEALTEKISPFDTFLQIIDGKAVQPLQNYGVQVNSIGFMLDADQPVVWRGPLVVQALTQLLEQTLWDDLDYLVVDMPPGTGDVQLTLAQKVPVTGAVIVTTPQDLALLDARRGYKMFDKVGIPTLGIVENMAVHVCSQCGHVEHIFGAGGGQRMAEQYGLECLGSLPLALHIREEADGGRPTVVAQPESAAAQSYRQIARKLAVAIADKAKDFSAKMPTIKISST
jgi:ATP-binding protein involved in chromosome partitioning